MLVPLISDPGIFLINECIKNNINIIPIPGPSADILQFYQLVVF